MEICLIQRWKFVWLRLRWKKSFDFYVGKKHENYSNESANFQLAIGLNKQAIGWQEKFIATQSD